MNEKDKPVVSGEELILEANGLYQIEAQLKWEKTALLRKTKFLENRLKDKLVVDRAWLMEQLKNFPNWRDDNYWNHDIDGIPTTFRQSKFRDNVIKWKEDFEKKLLGDDEK
jgi:hypothetical protein